MRCLGTFPVSSTNPDACRLFHHRARLHDEQKRTAQILSGIRTNRETMEKTHPPALHRLFSHTRPIQRQARNPIKRTHYIGVKMRHIIAYDISDPRRLQKAHRYLIQHAIPLQNSIFLHIGSREQARQCFEELCQMLHPKQGTCASTHWPTAAASILWGKPPCPKASYWATSAHCKHQPAYIPPAG